MVNWLYFNYCASKISVYCHRLKLKRVARFYFGSGETRRDFNLHLENLYLSMYEFIYTYFIVIIIKGII